MSDYEYQFAPTTFSAVPDAIAIRAQSRKIAEAADEVVLESQQVAYNHVNGYSNTAAHQRLAVELMVVIVIIWIMTI